LALISHLSIKKHNSSFSEYPLPVVESIDVIDNCEISIVNIFNELDKLNTKTSTGPDGISALFLYHCRFVLTPPIHKIFSLSLNKEMFPSYWKSSLFKPIFKNSSKSLVSNYRPIYFISVIHKFFSEIINFTTNFCFLFLFNTIFQVHDEVC